MEMTFFEYNRVKITLMLVGLKIRNGEHFIFTLLHDKGDIVIDCFAVTAREKGGRFKLRRRVI